MLWISCQNFLLCTDPIQAKAEFFFKKKGKREKENESVEEERL